jgi:hypothetical protein
MTVPEARVRRTFVACAFALLAVSHARADERWGVTEGAAVVRDLGGEFDSATGASLRLSSQTVGTRSRAGAITRVDAAPFRGGDVELQAQLTVVDGIGIGTLWLRADGPGGSLAFLNTTDRPVLPSQGAQWRNLRLYVPRAATSLKLGVILVGAGSIEVTALRIARKDSMQSAVDARAVIESALSTIQTHALNAERLDWESERARGDNAV